MCALGEIVFSRSESVKNIQTVSNFDGVDSERLSSEKAIFKKLQLQGPMPEAKRSRDGKDHASKWPP